jgi:hypothetical protein
MGAAVERLLKLVETQDAFNTPYAELLPLQIDAANERLEDRIGKIRLLANRAETAGMRRVRKPADLVPLLFAHTAYKSYAENWLTEGKWDRMGKWLETVSAYPVQGLDLDGIKGLDGWIERLETVGHYMTCSSGTTGKPALLTCSKDELKFAGRGAVRTLSWAVNIEPNGEYKMIEVGGAMKAARLEATRIAMIDAFSKREDVYSAPGKPITVGGIAEMISLRRKVADGSATPSEVTAFEEISAGRQAGVEQSRDAIAEAFIANRHRKLFSGGYSAVLYALAETVRAKGYSGKDFNPENVMMVAGGLKGAKLPANYKEYIFETFNVQPHHIFDVYSMQEINSQFPRCAAGRYHIPAWAMLLVLNESGEELLDTSGGGEIEGRAAFFDISVDARWGGIISGDKVKAHYGKCACGSHGPTVAQEIIRYADLSAGGDKLACSGTIDAYIRGAV